MGNQRSHAVGELGFVGPPIAQGRGVVVTAVEPAVVENEALDAHARGGAGQLHHLLRVDVEVEAFPGVQVHRPRAHAAAGPRQTRAQFGVEVGGQAVQARAGAACHDLGCAQGSPRSQQPLARCQPFAQLPLVLTVVQPFQGLLVVARPGEVSAVDKAGVGGGPGRGDHSARKAVV